MTAGRRVEDVYELSPMQQGMLFDTLSTSDPGLYVMQLVHELEGALDTDAFERAWQEVVRRHPVLRTSMHWDDLEKPLQVVHADVPAPVRSHDWRTIPEDDRERRFEQALERERRCGFAFPQPPLFRLDLFRFGEASFRFVWTFHHALLEGWSAAIVLGEVRALYRSIRRGRSEALPPRRPYREHILWLQGQDRDAAGRYWRETLRGFRAPTPLPGDGGRDRLHRPVTAYDARQRILPPDATAAIDRLARERRLTRNTIVQGAWAMLLSHHAGTRDVVWGTIVSGRSAPLPGIESMVGLFVNLVPVRAAVDPNAPAAEWLAHLQRTMLEIRSWESIALVDVKQWSEVPRGMPLFETLVVYENWLGDLAPGGWDDDLRAGGVQSFQGGPGVPLTLVVDPGPALAASLTFDRERIDDDDAEALLAHFEATLRALAAIPDAPVGEVLFRAGESRRPRLEDSSGPVLERAPICVHELFERQVERTPDAVAILHRGERITYREAEARVKRLARHLRGLGVGPEVRVATCLGHEPATPLALLAIHAAGGAYVPLDPDDPDERLRELTRRAGASIVVGRGDLAARFHPLSVRVVDVDAIPEDGSDAPGPALPKVDPRHLAYVIFTSGSTGSPKGVMIEHASLAHYVRSAVEAFDLSPSDRVLQFASVAFDAAAEEIFPCLAAGATLVPRTEEMLDSPRAFLAQCRDLGLTVLDLPTAFWHLLAADPEVTTLPPEVRLVIIGGERALAERVARWTATIASGRSLINTYGPTETTIVATLGELREDAARTAHVPVGRPVPNARAVVLDDEGRPVPAGIVGELSIGGVGLARGYLDDPAATAERFVPDPSSVEPGARRFASGDRARLRADGRLEILGRADDQVKVRGYRVEPAEIEAALTRHPEVREAAVHAVDERDGKRLVAAVVTGGEPGPTAGDLRRFLRKQVPAWMLPSAFVFVDFLPRTPTGKIDRRAMPLPEPARAPTGASFEAPGSSAERAVAAIWQELLQIERVSVHDNFFDLGGHSILAVHAIVSIEKKLGVRLSIGDLVFQTLAQVAATCATRPGSDEPAPRQEGAGK